MCGTLYHGFNQPAILLTMVQVIKCHLPEAAKQHRQIAGYIQVSLSVASNAAAAQIDLPGVTHKTVSKVQQEMFTNVTT